MNSMGRTLWRWVALMIALTFLFTILAPAIVRADGNDYEQQIAEQEKRLEQVRAQIEQQKAQLQQNEQKRQTLIQELANTQARLDIAQQELAVAEEELTLKARQVAHTEQELATTEAELEERTELLKNRVRAIYESRGLGYLEVLLKAEDLGDFFSRFSLLRQIVAADVDLFQQIRAERDKLAAQRVKLEQEKQQLAVLRNEAQAKRDAVQQEKNSQQQMMARIQSDKKMHERAIAELEELSEELIGIIQRLQLAQEGKLSTVNKDFTWPTAGPITSYFGRRFHPVLKVWKGHTGIDIGAPHGQQIKAAESGIVIFSGWLGGYGQAIIIDHGGGYSTLYAHASRLLASVNTTVVKGQHIANIGSTGLSTGPHLHFEIRVNGTPVNPLGMLP